MTEDDAILFYEMLSQRLYGWDIPISINPKTGYVDERIKRAKASHTFMVDMSLSKRGCFEDGVDLLLRGQSIATLWPETMREVINFRTNHRVPRDHNEPTSAISVATRAEVGNPPFPAWVLAHGLPATVDDHPPFPPLSDLYLAWRDTPIEPEPSNVIAFPGKWKGAA